MTEFQEGANDWQRLPLRLGWPFAVDHGLESEVVAIRAAPERLRRGLMIRLLQTKSLLDEFIETRWPNGRTSRAQRLMGQYIRRVERAEGLGFGAGDEEPDEVEDTFDNPEFALEYELESFMYNNWDRINFGRALKLYRGEDGRDGRQFDTHEVGRIDFLCEDTSDGSFLIIELKKGRPGDRVVGQIQRYMGWVSAHLADGRPVKGMIISPIAEDPGLGYALRVASGIEWKCYEVTFSLTSPNRS